MERPIDEPPTRYELAQPTSAGEEPSTMGHFRARKAHDRHHASWVTAVAEGERGLELTVHLAVACVLLQLRIE